ncbi:MAG: hypothetical protein OXH36_00365 [Bdellovibrionales bacterium]|nr:hypothetical protein [Bdellovibrionales bacterium]
MYKYMWLFYFLYQFGLGFPMGSFFLPRIKGVWRAQIPYRLGIVILVLFSSFSFAIKREAFPIKEELENPLTALLDEAVDLHHAIYSNQEGRIHLTLSKMINKIEELKQFPQLLPYHQQSYTYNLLQGLRPQLEAIKVSRGKRKDNINAINRTLTYMAHVYGLRKYAVFYCPKDKSVWIQKGNKKRHKRSLQNYRLCGDLVGK